MKIKIPKIVIGNNLTGMQVAIQQDATFIPVSYLNAFGWEHTTYDHHITQFIRSKRVEKDSTINHKYKISSKHGTEFIPCFYWELEALYKYILLMSNRLYDSHRVTNVKHYSDNVLTLVSAFGNSFEIEFDTCHVINPDYNWYDSISEPFESHESDSCHLIYYLILSKDTEDMKGIQYQYDIEELEEEYFTKIWYSSLFGSKKFLVGNDPRRKKQTTTTRNICLFIENVDLSEINDEKYSVAEIRKEIYKLLGSRHKRIADRILSFDKSIQKIELSSRVNVYEDTDNVKYLYYTDKEEILCPKNLDSSEWPQSYPRILISQFKETMILP